MSLVKKILGESESSELDELISSVAQLDAEGVSALLTAMRDHFAKDQDIITNMDVDAVVRGLGSAIAAIDARTGN